MEEKSPVPASSAGGCGAARNASSTLKEELESREGRTLASFIRGLRGKQLEEVKAFPDLGTFCTRAISPALKAFLDRAYFTSERILGIITDENNIFTLDDFVHHACPNSDPKKGKWPELVARLHLPLKIMGTDESLEEDHVGKLLDKCPAIAVLRKMPLDELKPLLTGFDHTAQQAIRSLHAERHPLRQQGLKDNLSDEAVMFFEKEGISDLKRVDAQKKKDLEKKWKAASNRPADFKKIFSKERQAQLEAFETPNPARTTSGNAGPTRLQTQHQTMMAGMGRPVDFGRPLSTNPRDDIRNHVQDNEGHGNIVFGSGNHDSDEKLVASASGGRMRKGVLRVGVELLQGTNFDVPEYVLDVPTKVDMFNPELETTKVTYHTFEEGVSENFLQHVRVNGFEMGGKFCVGLGLPIGRGSIGVSGNQETMDEHRKDKHEKEKSKIATVLQCDFVPLQDFRIPPKNIVLSQEAKDWLEKLGENPSLPAARDFIENFGDGIPMQKQTLGGIFYTAIEARTESAYELSTLKHGVSKAWETGFDVSGKAKQPTFNVAVGAEGKCSASDTNGSYEAEAKDKINYTCNAWTAVQGPACETSKGFYDVLSRNNKHWYIINRGNQDQVKLIFDLVKSCWKDEDGEDHPAAQSVSKLLKQAFELREQILETSLSSEDKKVLLHRQCRSSPAKQEPVKAFLDVLKSVLEKTKNSSIIKLDREANNIVDEIMTMFEVFRSEVSVAADSVHSEKLQEIQRRLEDLACCTKKYAANYEPGVCTVLRLFQQGLQQFGGRESAAKTIAASFVALMDMELDDKLDEAAKLLSSTTYEELTEKDLQQHFNDKVVAKFKDSKNSSKSFFEWLVAIMESVRDQVAKSMEQIANTWLSEAMGQILKRPAYRVEDVKNKVESICKTMSVTSGTDNSPCTYLKDDLSNAYPKTGFLGQYFYDSLTSTERSWGSCTVAFAAFRFTREFGPTGVGKEIWKRRFMTMKSTMVQDFAASIKIHLEEEMKQEERILAKSAGAGQDQLRMEHRQNAAACTHVKDLIKIAPLFTR